MLKLVGDIKVVKEDIDTMEELKRIYSENSEGLFVYLWVKKKIDLIQEKDLLLQKFRVKTIDLNIFKDNMIQQKGLKDKFFRCDKFLTKNIWEYIPIFASLIEKSEILF